ncbi:MAG: S-adenosylmethionine:tRNA ribosyltransferase-isomerase [Bacteroidales bacterium]|nr:S-adenosylmethionine:tRNA ribosyltransferase-isomerase [Bacteroidales bacterium]
MSFNTDLSIAAFDYFLPDHQIAQFPLADRSSSRLLYFNRKTNEIKDLNFKDLPQLLPNNSLVIFNETRVVMARLHFKRESGSRIEVFCLAPLSPLTEVQGAFQLGSGVEWKVLIGNAKKWKADEKLILSANTEEGPVELMAQRCGIEEDAFRVRFEWSPSHLSFAAILELFGKVPLPPYIGRKAEPEDESTYQTVYARTNGSVAAPTAGLHFTNEVFENLTQQGHKTCKTVLHVGAGTFKPVDNDRITEHHMHSEEVVISRSLLETLKSESKRPVVAIGTTTTRTLESIYWYAVLLEANPDALFLIDQWMPYSENSKISRPETIDLLLKCMDARKSDELKGNTSLLIAPGYTYRMVDALLTNFHQPKSTLLLLVSALIGDHWKRLYQHAIIQNYRFLSYGDACFFLP